MLSIFYIFQKIGKPVFDLYMRKIFFFLSLICAFKQKSTFSEALRQVQRNSERRHIVKTVCYKKPFSMLQRIVQCVTKYVTMSKYRSLFYREYSRLAPGMLQSTDKFVTKYVKIESLFDQWSCRESLFVFLLFWYTIFRGIIWQLIWYFW